MSDAGRDLAELLDRKNPDGTPLFSDDDVKNAIPLLAAGVVRAFPGADMPEFVVACVGEVAAKAGVDEKTAASDVWPALERWYKEHPNPLVAELERLLRTASAGGALDAARAAASVLGVATSKQPLDAGARPEGTVPAGPAARFAALKKTPKSK